MNNRLFAWVAFLLIAIYGVGCNGNSNGDKPPVRPVSNPPGDSRGVMVTEEALDTILGAGNILIDSEEAKMYISNFQRLHGNSNSGLSKSVWIDKEVVKYLINYLDTHSKRPDGIRLYMAAYDVRQLPRISGRDSNRHQSTIIIVPTIERRLTNGDSRSIHQDDWSILPEKLRKKGAANHGELCPTKCND